MTEHSITALAPLFNLGLLLIIVVLLILFVLWFRKTRNEWSAPKQAAEISQVQRKVEHAHDRIDRADRETIAAHNKADAIAREQDHYRREQSDVQDRVIKEIRSLASQLGTFISLRDEVQDIRDLATKLEQEVTSLVCFEDAQTRKQALPGFCPLRKIPCPIEGELPPIVVVPTPAIIPVNPPKE